MAYAYENLFKQSSIPKKLILEFDNGEIIDNERIFSESMKLTESICSNQELTFGCVESNCFKVTLSDTVQSHKNLWFTAYLVLNNNNSTKYKLGRYFVVEDKAQADHSRRDITAYDMLYKIVNTDVSEWYKALSFPITLKSFRKSFCDLFGISQVSTTLVNDSMKIAKTIFPETLSGAEVLSSYCELNGVFPNINRSGKIEYLKLPTALTMKELYPSNTLYPANDLLPQETNASRIYKSEYRSCKYDEFTTQKITKLQIRKEENDIGAISGEGDNCYIIEDNFLVYGKGADDLKTIADNLYNLISTYEIYRPYEVLTVGNPCKNLGEGVIISTKYEIINSFILKRVLSGINALKDTYSAKGVENYNEKEIIGVNNSIIQLKAQTNVLKRTVEESVSTLTKEITDLGTDITSSYKSEIKQSADEIEGWVKSNLYEPEYNADGSVKTDSNGNTVYSDITKVSKVTATAEEIKSKVYVKKNGSYTGVTYIEQNANEIELRVKKTNVISAINLSEEKVTISASKINFNGMVTANDNFKILNDGSMQCSGAKITSLQRWGTPSANDYMTPYLQDGDKLYTEVTLYQGSLSGRFLIKNKVLNEETGESETAETYSFDIGSVSFNRRINEGIDGDGRTNYCTTIKAGYGYLLDAPRFFVTAYDGNENGNIYQGHNLQNITLWAYASDHSAVGATLHFKNGLLVGYTNPGIAGDWD